MGSELWTKRFEDTSGNSLISNSYNSFNAQNRIPAGVVSLVRSKTTRAVHALELLRKRRRDR